MRSTRDLSVADSATALGGGPAARSPALREQLRPATAEFAPVFLHSSFRTGSTWLWSKIRSAPTTLAYYEIFHELLATMTRQQVAQLDPPDWDTRHPITAAYFLEFLPLLSADGGIAEFDRREPLEGFIPSHGPDGELARSDKAYVDRLVAEARAKRRIPVLSCTRSLGRARALRGCIGGKSVVLYRNLFHQWASYCWQRENGNSYFMDTIRVSLNAAKHDPFLHSIANWYGLAELPIPEEKLFSAFVLLHLYLFSVSYDAADLMVDLPEMVSDKHVRYHVEDEIAKMISWKIDLSDVREHCDFSPVVSESPQRMWDTIDQFAKMIPAEGVSAESVAFVGKAREAAFDEWAKFEFYNRRTRAVLVKKIYALESGRTQQSVQIDALNDEVAKLRNSMAAGESETRANAQRADEAEAHVLELRADLSLGSEAQSNATLEKEAVAQRLAQVEAEADGLRAAASTSMAERDAALAKIDALQVDLADTISSRNELHVSLSEARSTLDGTFYQRARRRLLRPR